MYSKSRKEARRKTTTEAVIMPAFAEALRSLEVGGGCGDGADGAYVILSVRWWPDESRESEVELSGCVTDDDTSTDMSLMSDAAGRSVSIEDALRETLEAEVYQHDKYRNKTNQPSQQHLLISGYLLHDSP